MPMFNVERRVLLLTGIALLALAIVVFVPEWYMLVHTHGQFALPSDAAFVNASVTQNLAFHEVWGLSKYSFQPAASSFLYPIVLTPFFFIFGAHAIIPVVVNFLAAGFFLILLQQWMDRRSIALRIQVTVIFLFVALSPLLIISGLEFMVWVLLAFLFFSTLFDISPDAQTVSSKLFLYAAALVACRYEGLFLVTIAGAILIYRQQAWILPRLLGAALLPLLFFGVICVSKKASFIPPAMWGVTGGWVYWAALATVLLVLLFTGAPGIAKVSSEAGMAGRRVAGPAMADRRAAVRVSRGPSLVSRASAMVVCGVMVVFYWIALVGAVNSGIQLMGQQYQAARFLHLYYHRLPVIIEM